MFGTLIKIFKLLNSETGPWQLAFGVSLGMIVGLTPLLSLHNLIVILVALWCRVNLSLFFTSFGLFSGIAYLLDPMFHHLGYAALNAMAMLPLWTEWYNDAFMRWTRFNNSIVMGSLLCSLLALPFMTFLARLGVQQYRLKWQARLEKTPLMRWLQTTRVTEAFTRLGD